jgi:hypothetical protein
MRRPGPGWRLRAIRVSPGFSESCLHAHPPQSPCLRFGSLFSSAPLRAGKRRRLEDYRMGSPGPGVARAANPSSLVDPAVPAVRVTG